MKNKILFPVVVLLMISHWGLADEINYWNKGKAYIIDNDGKRIDGFIKYTNEMELMRSIQFTPTQYETYKTYTPNDIKSFQFINGAIYDAYDIDQEEGTTNRFFLKLISKSGTKLYKFKDGNGSRFFVLLERELIALRKQKSAKSGLREHIETLRAITAECAKVKVRNSLPYSSFAILSVLHNYDKCKQAQSAIQGNGKIKPAKIKWDALLRFNANIGVPLNIDGGGRGTVKQLGIEYNLKSNPMKVGQAFVLGLYKQSSVNNIRERSIFSPSGLLPGLPVYRFVDNFGYFLKYRLTSKPLRKTCFTSAIGIISANETLTIFNTINNTEDTQRFSSDLYYTIDIGFRYAFNKRHELRFEISSGKFTSIQIGYAAAFFE